MRRADLAIGTGLLVFAIVYFQLSFAITRGFASDRLGPAFFPRLLALTLAVLAMVLIVRAVSGRSDPSRPPAIRVGVFLGLLGLLVLYALLLPHLGFVLTTPVLVAGAIWLLGLRQWGSLAGTAVGVTAVLYLVFARTLHVLLPMGPLR
ncbi:MAG: tripartite tricarboxylate transporter TctB family protein [bacterium]